MSNFDWSSNSVLVTGGTGSFMFRRLASQDRHSNMARADHRPARLRGQRTKGKIIKVTNVGRGSGETRPPVSAILGHLMGYPSLCQFS
jgi:hypothetical protein